MASGHICFSSLLLVHIHLQPASRMQTPIERHSCKLVFKVRAPSKHDFPQLCSQAAALQPVIDAAADVVRFAAADTQMDAGGVTKEAGTF